MSLSQPGPEDSQSPQNPENMPRPKPVIPKLEPQSGGKVFATLLTEPPLLLSLIGALLFLANVILLPSSFAFNLVWAILGGYIVYGAVRRANTLTSIRQLPNPAVDSGVFHFMLRRPKFGSVMIQIFKSAFNIVFLVALLLTIVALVEHLSASPVVITSVLADILLAFAYFCFVISNAYTRAQVKAAGMPLTWAS